MDFICPIIEIGKILTNKEQGKKLTNFLEYMSNFDYKGLINLSQNIYNAIQGTTVDVKSDNKLSTLIKASNPSYTDEDVDNICKELIECGVIRNNGKFNKNFIQIKGFKQSFKLIIDEKYLEYKYDPKRRISEELEKKIDFIALRVSKLTLDNRKKEIKDEIYNRMETFMQSLIERILDILEDKISEQFEKLLEKYKKKKIIMKIK